MWPISEGRLSTVYFARREAGRGEFPGFQGVTEADRGNSPPVTLLTVVYATVLPLAWLHNQVKTFICARVNHGRQRH